ncbi:FUSC family protein [Corynebacterium tapiri]|uniref:FUSC family protein n=1 Tax=Corynebacterium tapiri TaxID=1448266 RepID=UPI001FEABE32|nr:FUSC family protein [Corynebacterium tapiri]
MEPRRRISTRQRLAVIDRSLQSRLTRLRKRWLSVVQVAVASGLAFYVAQLLWGHATPFFAPITSIIVIGFSGGERVKRALEMSFACVLGVLIGDLLLYVLGTGLEPWHITLMVGVAYALASFLSNSQLVANQVAIGTVLIATILRPDADVTGIDRTLDAFVGSVIGLLVVALIPSSALGEARQKVANLLALQSSVLHDVAEGLSTSDPDLIAEALRQVRSSQSNVDAMVTAAKSSLESTKISPLMWGSRRYARSIGRVLIPADNTVRTARVLARRAYVLTADKDSATQKQIELIDELGDIAYSLSLVFQAKSTAQEAAEIPDLVRRLRVVGAELDMSVAGENPVLSNYALLAQSRSYVADLLQVCGMSHDSAVAVLAPTTDTPAVPPEVWEP